MTWVSECTSFYKNTVYLLFIVSFIKIQYLYSGVSSHDAHCSKVKSEVFYYNTILNIELKNNRKTSKLLFSKVKRSSPNPVEFKA